MKILVVEDEQLIREFEVAYLRQAGFTVLEAEDGKEGLHLFKKEKPDIVLLDLNLPFIDGIQVCKKIREYSQVPILMVTARTEEIDELLGLQIGADDYIKKPFSPAILIARVKNLLKRFDKKDISIHDLIINPKKMTVQKGEKVIDLSVTQFNIFYTLASNPGIVFTRDQILDKAYTGTSYPDVMDRTIDAHIKSIRKLIDDSPSESKYIVTVVGKGYKFIEKL